MFASDTAAAFLRTILDSPEDDTPRLVFADWLDEQDQTDRAEFIRIQCELSQLRPSDPHYSTLKSREQRLLAMHQVQWRNELPHLPGIEWEQFERGFVSAVRASQPEDFLSQTDAIMSATPIRHVSLHRLDSAKTVRLAELPALKQIEILDLEDGNHIGNAGLEALSASPYLSRLQVLKLRGNGIGPAGVFALARSQSIRQLKNLDLDRNEIFEEGVRSLAESSGMNHLRYLSLGWTRMGDVGLIALSQSPYLKQLVWLYLVNNQIQDDGIEFLAQSSMNQLRALYLDYNHITDRGAVALAHAALLKWIEVFSLKNNRVSEQGGRAIAESPYLGMVRELILMENPLGSSAEALRQRFRQKVWLY